MAQILNMFASLDVRHGDASITNENCLAKLEEILNKLQTEDQTLRTYRRAVCFGENIRKDLIPLLVHLKDDTRDKVKDATIKILVNLTIPIENLLPVDQVAQSEIGKHTIFEINKLLTSTKEAFTDGRSTKAIVDHIKFIVESDVEMNDEYCESINNCLMLLRNILHVPEMKTASGGAAGSSSMQNQIIWNLFAQSVDKVIIFLISCPQKMYWSVTIVQLIALLYKDQHVGTLQKLLNMWLEASLSESSEDNESNTSPPDQGSDDSSPVITSDPTSDSSDNGGCGKNDIRSAPQIRSGKTLAGIMRGKSTETDISVSSSGVSSMATTSESTDFNNKIKTPKSLQQNINNNVLINNNNNNSNSINNTNNTNTKINNKECLSSQSEDFGYVTQVENQESISTSSNEEDQPQQKPVHQKPHTFQKTRYSATKHRNATTALEKKELRRKKLVKRSKTNIINLKGLMHHLPTDEDVANILKEFTVDFLLKGYGTLVHDLYTQLSTNVHCLQIDTSHFFWLVTYFLKFSVQLELDLEHVGPVLSQEILSFLIFQGIWICEELETHRKLQHADLKAHLRRLHLVVTAIKEFVQALDSYQKMIHLSEDDRILLLKLRKDLLQTEDLRFLFIFLLRQYDPSLQTRHYLQDLIVTNHNIVLILDDGASKESRQSFDIMEHLKQFATRDMMRQYGLMLESFRENGEFVNNCIFTMMHHVGGDLEHVSALLQPNILKTFTQIWESEYEIEDDWSDLIEYIIHKFINTPRPSTSELNNLDGTQDEWTDEDKHNLLGYYNQNRKSHDAIANITKKYEKTGKTPFSIIGQLLEQNIINEVQFGEFMRVKRRESRNETKLPNARYLLHIEETDGDIRVLKEYLCKDDKGEFIIWLQKILIETCYVKLALAKREEFERDVALREPIIYHFSILNLPIRVIPWTSEQNKILKYQPFVLLLHKLGFYLPIDTGKMFVSIPNFWNAEHVFELARQLGPIDSGTLKFDVATFSGAKRKDSFQREIVNLTNSFKRGKFTMGGDAKPFSSFTNPLSLSIPRLGEIPCSMPQAPELCIAPMDCRSPNHDDNERNSTCETASIASDLTRMCVSDEDDKIVMVVEQKNCS